MNTVLQSWVDWAISGFQENKTTVIIGVVGISGVVLLKCAQIRNRKNKLRQKWNEVSKKKVILHQVEKHC